MGFGLTAMLTVLYSYVTGLGGAVAGIIGTLPKDVAEKIGFVEQLQRIVYDWYLYRRYLPCSRFTSKIAKKLAVAAPSTPSESGEIEDDEF